MYVKQLEKVLYNTHDNSIIASGNNEVEGSSRTKAQGMCISLPGLP